MSDAFFNDDFFCTRTHSQFDIDAQRLIDFQLLGFRYGSYSFNKFTSGRVFNLSNARRRRSFFQGLSR